MFRLLGIAFVLCLVGQPSFGDDSHKVTFNEGADHLGFARQA